MKNQLITLKEKYTLRKRAIIESVNDILTSVFDLEHSRHRKPINAFTHMAATIVAYHVYPENLEFLYPTNTEFTFLYRLSHFGKYKKYQ